MPQYVKSTSQWNTAWTMQYVLRNGHMINMTKAGQVVTKFQSKNKQILKHILSSYPPVAMPRRSDMTLKNFAVQSSFSSPGPWYKKKQKPHDLYDRNIQYACVQYIHSWTTVELLLKYKSSSWQEPISFSYCWQLKFLYAQQWTCKIT